MIKKKASFFERLTGSIDTDEDTNETDAVPMIGKEDNAAIENSDWNNHNSSDGELAVDVYQTDDEIIVKAMIAGVRPEDLDVTITRDMVTIRGAREEKYEIDEGNYYHKELYWGSFSRTILLPEEVESEEAEAIEKHGLLEIHIPKIDRKKTKTLKIKSV